MKKTIFLDFDGVLHGEGINSKQFFEHVGLLCNFIRPYKEQVQIVISSSWREEKSLETLKQYFPEDLREIFVGVTPKIVESYTKGGREKEILLYCYDNGISDWIALDDQPRFFSDHCKNLILVDGEIGLCFGDIKMIEHFLSPYSTFPLLKH